MYRYNTDGPMKMNKMYFKPSISGLQACSSHTSEAGFGVARRWSLIYYSLNGNCGYPTTNGYKKKQQKWRLCRSC